MSKLGRHVGQVAGTLALAVVLSACAGMPMQGSRDEAQCAAPRQLVCTVDRPTLVKRYQESRLENCECARVL